MTAIIFDFDGVLIESEHVSAKQISATLTRLGHPTTVDQALDAFTGLGGQDFLDAVAAHTGIGIPDGFVAARQAEDARVVAEGVAEVAGAAAYVHSLPADLPIAIASSSTTHWLRAHLDHLGLRERFEPHIYSGREHVARGKPAPDIYLYAAAQLGIPIADCVIVEDSVVGVIGALASGARVLGFAAGRHCRHGHADRLRERGVSDVAHSFADVAALIADGDPAG
ncbi:6-phosphogluconate phosphatase [Sphingomonas antarctica]|uniref:HAD family hydrolase n=1 Tax=Sphingomonas antarctica TaxID=2040274 RepID=UPI0039E91FA8